MLVPYSPGWVFAMALFAILDQRPNGGAFHICEQSKIHSVASIAFRA